VAAITGVLFASGASVGQSGPTAADFLKMVATDNSNTISLPQIDAFATKKFDELKRPGEGALSMDDLRGRIFLRRISTPRILLAETLSRHSVGLNF
jgi:hypothetical protein